VRVEPVIFAVSRPVARGTHVAPVGGDCYLDPLIADIRAALRSRSHERVDVAAARDFNAARGAPKASEVRCEQLGERCVR
jgi:hypothetical protein